MTHPHAGHHPAHPHEHAAAHGHDTHGHDAGQHGHAGHDPALAQWALEASQHATAMVHQTLTALSDVYEHPHDHDKIATAHQDWTALAHTAEEVWHHLSQIGHSDGVSAPFGSGPTVPVPDWYHGMEVAFDQLRTEMHNDGQYVDALAHGDDHHAKQTAQTVWENLSGVTRFLENIQIH